MECVEKQEIGFGMTLSDNFPRQDRTELPEIAHGHDIHIPKPFCGCGTEVPESRDRFMITRQ